MMPTLPAALGKVEAHLGLPPWPVVVRINEVGLKATAKSGYSVDIEIKSQFQKRSHRFLLELECLGD